MVAVAWRAFTAAARWNGQAPHVTTGVASSRASHCQYGNRTGGTIASSSSGAVSPAATSTRRRGGGDPDTVGGAAV